MSNQHYHYWIERKPQCEQVTHTATADILAHSLGGAKLAITRLGTRYAITLGFMKALACFMPWWMILAT
jgi:hypothetical protein